VKLPAVEEFRPGGPPEPRDPEQALRIGSRHFLAPSEQHDGRTQEPASAQKMKSSEQ